MHTAAATVPLEPQMGAEIETIPASSIDSWATAHRVQRA
jgi:hypothetical protein